MKVVLDSNIYISAFCFDKDPERLIDLGSAGVFRIFTSLYIIDEVRKVMRKLGMGTRFIYLATQRIERISTVVPVWANAKGPIPTDLKDGPIVKTCLASKADFLVTRDKALLALQIFGVKSLNAGNFLGHLRLHGVIKD